MGKLLDENSLRAIRTFVNTSIANAISAVYKPQGSSSVSGLNGLTKVEAMNGYVYDVTNSGNLTQHNGSTIHINKGENAVFIWNHGNWYWDILGSIIDLSTLVPKNNSAQALTGAVKVNVDANGLVIGSSSLLEADIPILSISKISGLQTTLDAKVVANTAITGATKCKITYDSKGLVTAGADLAASDIPDLSATYVPVEGNVTINGTKTFAGEVNLNCPIILKNGVSAINFYKVNGSGPSGAYIRGIGNGNNILLDTTTLYLKSGATIYDGNTSSSLSITLAQIIAKYDKPSGGIPASDLAETYSLSTHNHDGSYVAKNSDITGATKCKITYDSKGLVTAGADLAASDIPDLSATYVPVEGNVTINGTKTFASVVYSNSNDLTFIGTNGKAGIRARMPGVTTQAGQILITSDGTVSGSYRLSMQAYNLTESTSSGTNIYNTLRVGDTEGLSYLLGDTELFHVYNDGHATLGGTNIAKVTDLPQILDYRGS